MKYVTKCTYGSGLSLTIHQLCLSHHSQIILHEHTQHFSPSKEQLMSYNVGNLTYLEHANVPLGLDVSVVSCHVQG